MIATGGYVADRVHGFQTSFDRSSANDPISYYDVIYYGGIAQAVYRSVLVFLAITVIAPVRAWDRHKTKRTPINVAGMEELVPRHHCKGDSQG